MKSFSTLAMVWSAILISVLTCSAQMYKMKDLGTLGGSFSHAAGVNLFGQVAGDSGLADGAGHAFRTEPNRPINPARDDLGTFGATAGKGDHSEGHALNDLGQVAGGSFITYGSVFHAYRTRPNRPINLATDDLGTLGESFSTGNGINVWGQVVGNSSIPSGIFLHAFRTKPNRAINPATDDLGTLGGMSSQASGVNVWGQTVGLASLADNTTMHGFRTRPNRAINPATDDLGTLGGSSSSAIHVNIFGQAVGTSSLAGDVVYHAFRTGPNRAIQAATDDLGTLGGNFSSAASVDDFGQVVGWASTAGDAEQHAFLYSGGAMHDLNDLIAPGSSCTLNQVSDINDFGQIAADGTCGGQPHALLLTPIYRATARAPIRADGSSVFAGNGRVVPVKFTLTRNGMRTCNLPPATIAITKANGNAMEGMETGAFATSENGAMFRTTGCQYMYQLDSGSLGGGTYRVDISIRGVLVGNAVFVIR